MCEEIFSLERATRGDRLQNKPKCQSVNFSVEFYLAAFDVFLAC